MLDDIKEKSEASWSADELHTLTRGDLEFADDAETGDEVKNREGNVIGRLTRVSQLEHRDLKIPLNWIFLNPDQPRGDKSLTREELDSDEDQIEPIVVVPFYHTKHRGIRFFIRSGELRFLKAQHKNQQEMLCRVEWNATLSEIFRKTLISDVVRKRYNPIEMAEAFRKRIKDMIDAEGVANEAAAKRNLANELEMELDDVHGTLRLLNLEQRIQELIRRGRLNVTKAEEMTAKWFSSPALQRQLAERLTKLAKETPKGEALPARGVDKIISDVRSLAARTATSSSAVTPVKSPIKSRTLQSRPRVSGGQGKYSVKPAINGSAEDRSNRAEAEDNGSAVISSTERRCVAIGKTIRVLGLQMCGFIKLIDTEGLRAITASGERDRLYRAILALKRQIIGLSRELSAVEGLLEPPDSSLAHDEEELRDAIGGNGGRIQVNPDSDDDSVIMEDPEDPEELPDGGDPIELNFDLR